MRHAGHVTLLAALWSVVLSPLGTFLCEVHVRQCPVGPRTLVGLFQHSAFLQGVSGADYFNGTLYVFRRGRHGDLEAIGRFPLCSRLARGVYQCGP